MNIRMCTRCFAALPEKTKVCPSCKQAWQRIGETKKLELLTEALRSGSQGLRWRAISLIGLCGHKQSADTLVACALRHADSVEEGMCIIDALSVIDGGKPNVAALRYLYVRHPRQEIKHAVAVLTAAAASQSQDIHPKSPTLAEVPA